MGDAVFGVFVEPPDLGPRGAVVSSVERHRLSARPLPPSFPTTQPHHHHPFTPPPKKVLDRLAGSQGQQGGGKGRRGVGGAGQGDGEGKGACVCACAVMVLCV